MKEMTAEDFYSLWQEESLSVIDVREVDEFLEGHVEGSQNFPLSNLAEDYRDLQRDQPYYVICHSGKRSLAACEFLQERGLDVTNVQGGVTHFPVNLVAGEKE